MTATQQKRVKNSSNHAEKLTLTVNQSHLVLNVQKTKEIILDFRRSLHSHEPITIHRHPIEQVPEYKYLGTIIDNKLNWNSNSQVLAGKANQRLYFLRKLREFRVDNTILVLFYQSLLQSILTFSLVCMYGNLSNENVKKLDRARKVAQRITHTELPTIGALYEKKILLKIHKIMQDSSHPLHELFKFNSSGICLTVSKTIRCRFRQSFVPNAIHIFNNSVRQ